MKPRSEAGWGGTERSPRTVLRGLFAAKRPEPSYPQLPQVDGRGQSTVPGIYLVGELAGTPLIKLGLNAGVDVIDAIAGELPPASSDREGGDEPLDVLIVGAGSAGLGAAARAAGLGLRYTVIEAGRVAQTVLNMYRGKFLFAEPADVDNRSAMWFEECEREQLLERWHAQIGELGLSIHEHERVLDVRPDVRTDVGAEVHGNAGVGELGFVVQSDRAEYRARRVVLAMGKAGNPRKAGVQGELEHAARVLHTLSDPEAIEDQRVLIYGGGDVAAEAALALCDRNHVTMVTIDDALTYPKKRNREALLEKQAQGALELHLSSALEAIGDASVQIRDAAGESHTLDNDLVFEMIGAELPLGFFEKIGVRLEGSWHLQRWLYLAAVSLLVYCLYALKKFPEEPYSFPFNLLFSREGYAASTRALFEPAFAPFAWVFDAAAYEEILGTLWFQQGYLYSLLYTIVMIVFGVQAFHRWSALARDSRYQRYRYASLITFQIGFFLIANVIAVQALSIQYAWRAWGLYQPWPLFFNTFHWWQASDPRALIYGFAGAGLVGTFVLIPWASHRHGKRFCTFICGCGGLAETLGDRYRHLSAKGPRSRQWEFQGMLVLIAAALVTLVTVGAHDTRADNAWAMTYSYVVDFWLVAVIPIALYPFFGGKVWCRYWCPLAAYNGILAKLYGKLEITSNDQCISCTQCSRHCQVGVDVMAFAKNGEPFDNRNSACIQCGICVDVCPVDVLSFSQRDQRELADVKRRLPLA